MHSCIREIMHSY